MDRILGSLIGEKLGMFIFRLERNAALVDVDLGRNGFPNSYCFCATNNQDIILKQANKQANTQKTKNLEIKRKRY